MKKLMTIPVSKIVFDKELYPRNDYYWQTAYEYSESMKLGKKFPPIVVAKFENNLILVDGKHRLEAYKTLKTKNVKAEIIFGLKNKAEIFEEAIKRNITHGQKLAIQERLYCAIKLADWGYTQVEVSTLVNISPKKITELMGRKLVSSVTGEQIILKKDIEHIKEDYEDKPVPENKLVMQSTFMGKNNVSIIDELIDLIATKTLDLKNKEVKKRLKVLKTLLRKVNI
jgi:ParB-like chromosome segregation protein Spo0J